jgi:hypothetical protein
MLESLTPVANRSGPRPTSMARVAVASSMGSIIEFYDFLIYGTAAALVFPQVFVPALGPGRRNSRLIRNFCRGLRLAPPRCCPFRPLW